MLLKVVFDTNVFISAIIFGGNPRECLELAREKKIELVTSGEILLELSGKLHYKFGMGQTNLEKIIAGISKFAIVIKPKEEILLIKDDISDNIILEAANESNADYIISGDKKHILPLGKFKKTKILTAAEFLRQF